jgi:hypothetical protein
MDLPALFHAGYTHGVRPPSRGFPSPAGATPFGAALPSWRSARCLATPRLASRALLRVKSPLRAGGGEPARRPVPLMGLAARRFAPPGASSPPGLSPADGGPCFHVPSSHGLCRPRRVPRPEGRFVRGDAPALQSLPSADQPASSRMQTYPRGVLHLPSSRPLAGTRPT